MAEFVNYKQENQLTLYEEMKTRKLVTEAELREIIKTRAEFEYKLVRKSREIKDFAEYISYERSLLTKMIEREKELNPQRNLKENKRKKLFGPIENFIAQHIKKLFQQGMQFFPNETKIWEGYIKFCKCYNFNVEISNAFEKILKYHGNDVNVWLHAIKWEAENIKNIEKAKDLILRGIQKHQDNEELYIEFLKIMLMEAEQMDGINLQHDSGVTERDLGLKRIEIIYKNSRKKIFRIDYLIKILNILDEYPFTENLQKMIINDMTTSFPNNELTWHTLAQYELKGKSVANLMKDVSADTKENEKSTQQIDEAANNEEKTIIKSSPRAFKRKIELCCDVYESAVKTIKTEKMWNFYLNTMLELNRDMNIQPILKRQKLSEAFKGAIDAKLMSEQHFQTYIELVKETKPKKEFMEEVFEKAVQIHSTSIKLWLLWMQYYIELNDSDKVNEIFRMAVKKLKENEQDDSLLWKTLIKYKIDNKEKVDKIFLEAIQQRNDNFLEFRVQYLEWVYNNKGIDNARKLYDEIQYIPPPYYELHHKMECIELKQNKLNRKKLAQIYENILRFFGKNRIDVWINYIKYERDHGSAQKMSLLYERAKSTLDADLLNLFISEYNLFMEK